jgi:hypothetical protein
LWHIFHILLTKLLVNFFLEAWNKLVNWFRGSSTVFSPGDINVGTHWIYSYLRSLRSTSGDMVSMNWYTICYYDRKRYLWPLMTYYENKRNTSTDINLSSVWNINILVTKCVPDLWLKINQGKGHQGSNIVHR